MNAGREIAFYPLGGSRELKQAAREAVKQLRDPDPGVCTCGRWDGEGHDCSTFQPNNKPNNWFPPGSSGPDFGSHEDAGERLTEQITNALTAAEQMVAAQEPPPPDPDLVAGLNRLADNVGESAGLSARLAALEQRLASGT
jgi:hypothetical protein